MHWYALEKEIRRAPSAVTPQTQTRKTKKDSFLPNHCNQLKRLKTLVKVTNFALSDVQARRKGIYLEAKHLN